MEPTNLELKKIFDAHSRADEAFQKEQMEFNEAAEKSRIAIHKKLNEIPTKEETAVIVEDVITKLLLQKGKTIYTGIIALSLLIGALVVIFGGAKTALGWLGFVSLK